ncbi:MAG: PGF-pre-PGF domain-containing protein, partial [Candidatus Thermoplasmatota archaeon]|nr:PGF-pre-PGF domain-containing protein [Candidatus Thermoplasmatota archaeon]
SERIPFSGIYEDQQKFPVEKHSIINKDTTEVFIIIDNDNKYKVEILFHEDSENKNLAEMFEGGLHKRFSVKDLHIYDIEEINVFDTTNNLVTDKQEVKRVLRALSGWLLAKHDQENNSGMSVFERLDYESEGVFTEIIESKQTVLGLSKNLACPLEFWQKNILWEESLQNSVGYSLSQGGNPPGLSDEESELIDGIVKDIVEGLDEEGKAIVDGFIRAMVKSAIVTDEGINYLRTIQEFYAYSDEQTNEFEKAIATTINKYDEENDEKRLEENLKGFLKDLLKDKGNEQLNEILKVGLKEIQNHLSEKSAAVFGKVVSGVGMGYTIANILIDGCGVFECAIDQTSSIYVLKEYGVAEKQLSEHLATSKTIDLQESYTYISLRKMEFSTLSYSYQQLADMNDVSVYAKLLSKTLPKLGITADKNEILKVSADWRNMAYDPEHATEFLYSCTPGYRDYTIEPAISSIVMFPGEEKIIKLQIRPSVSYVEYQVFYLNEVGKPSVTLSKPLNTEEETFFYVTIDAAKNIRPDRYHGTILINTQEKSFQYYLDINVIPEDQLKVDIVNLECNQYITSSEPTEIMVYVSNKGRPITGADVKANIYGSTSNTIEVLTLAEKGTGYYSTTFNAFYPEIYDVFVIANKRHTFNLLGYSPGSDSVNSLWSYDKKVKEDAFSGEIYPDTKIEKVDNIDTLEIYIQYELDWEGSDLNLHLYDSQGRHTGINEYGEIETQIPTSKYSGNVKPEWITIENSSLINMVTVVIEAIDVPISGEEYTLVKKYVTNESIFIVGSDEDKVSVGGSSGGGGGGGTTGENFENIAYKNVLNEFVSAGSVTSYDFDNEQNAIEYIRFKAFRNWGQISSTIEMLHNRSALVDVDAPDTVYCNVNLWVGKSGFSSSDNIEDPVVGFKVKKSWIEQNSIDEDTIRLCRYSDGQWSDLQTQKISEDDNYLHFEASTPGFSPFAIVGTSRKYIVDENIEVLKSTEDGSLAEDKDDFAITNPDSKPVNGVAIGLLFILLIGGIAGYVMYRKRG